MQNSDARYVRFVERYASDQVPWAVELPPPEVMAFAEEVPSGRGLDLGCGYGRCSIYLAQKGWLMDGVDFIPQAIAEAEQRSKVAGVAERINFNTAPVTALDFLSGSYDLIVDVGCMHAFDTAELEMYRDHVVRLLADDGIYLLFAHLRDATADSPRWILETDLRGLFVRDFELLDVEYGRTQVADNPPWPSAWYRYRRRIT